LITERLIPIVFRRIVVANSIQDSIRTQAADSTDSQVPISNVRHSAFVTDRRVLPLCTISTCFAVDE